MKIKYHLKNLLQSILAVLVFFTFQSFMSEARSENLTNKFNIAILGQTQYGDPVFHIEPELGYSGLSSYFYAVTVDGQELKIGKFDLVMALPVLTEEMIQFYGLSCDVVCGKEGHGVLGLHPNFNKPIEFKY